MHIADGFLTTHILTKVYFPCYNGIEGEGRRYRMADIKQALIDDFGFTEEEAEAIAVEFTE